MLAHLRNEPAAANCSREYMPTTLKQPSQIPALPVFFVERWHTVHTGLHLIFLSLVCAILALLPPLVVCIAIALGGGESWNFHGLYMPFLAVFASTAIVGVCVAFGLLGHTMCCAAPLSSKSKQWIIYSLILDFALLLPGAGSWFAYIVFIEINGSVWFAHRIWQVSDAVGYLSLFLPTVASVAHAMFAIGLLKINRAFANRAGIRTAENCLSADYVVLGLNAFLLFIVFAARAAGTWNYASDNVMTGLAIGGASMPPNLLVFFLFLKLIHKTRMVVARGIAERTGASYLLK